MKYQFIIKTEDIQEFLEQNFSFIWDGRFYEPIDIDNTCFESRRGIFEENNLSRKEIGLISPLDADYNKKFYSLAVNSHASFVMYPITSKNTYIFSEEDREECLKNDIYGILRDTSSFALKQDYSKEWEFFLVKKYPAIKDEVISLHEDNLKHSIDTRDDLMENALRLDRVIKEERIRIEELKQLEVNSLSNGL